jgi:hypothetical protein
VLIGYVYGYADGGDPRIIAGNTLNVGYETFNNIADGTGINYSASASETLTYTNGQTVASDTYGTGADRWRVVFNAFARGFEFIDYTNQPTNGTIIGYNGGSITYSAPCQNFNIGTYSEPIQANGYGGSFGGGQSNTYNAGPTYLGYCGNQNDGYQFYHHDGYGNVTQGNAPAGFQLSSSTSSQSLSWTAPDGTIGTFAWETCSGGTWADGNGGTYSNGGCTYANNGEVIASGSYVNGSTSDENGNTVDTYGSYQLTYNGSGSYNTNTY